MSDTWFSIEDAPKDGTEIILANVRKRHQWMDEWVTDASKDHGGYWLFCDQWDVPEEPTHFKYLSPLPEAPLADWPDRPLICNEGSSRACTWAWYRDGDHGGYWSTDCTEDEEIALLHDDAKFCTFCGKPLITKREE